MGDVEQIRKLTVQALDDFESGSPVSALVRRAHRIAVLRHDYAAQVWFTTQQRDLTAFGDNSDLRALRAKLIALLGQDAGWAEYTKQAEKSNDSRKLNDGSGKLSAYSIDQIEVQVKHLEDAIAEREVPSNLHSYDAGVMVQQQRHMREQLTPQLMALTNVLARVRQATHDYLVATEAELDAGREESSFFDRVYTRINALLNRYAPEAAKKFIAAQDRVSSGDAEAISHALTSCRRMIKSLADELYPATDEEKIGIDNVPRKMSDSAYKNRLLQYVREQIGKHKTGEVLQTVISDLGKRIDALDGLANKGVHADTSIAEAHTCVLQTYLLAGDLLAIAEGTSLLLTDSAESPA